MEIKSNIRLAMTQLAFIWKDCSNSRVIKLQLIQSLVSSIFLMGQEIIYYAHTMVTMLYYTFCETTVKLKESYSFVGHITQKIN